jgi:sigma-54 dependent transcriptional regulator
MKPEPKLIPFRLPERSHDEPVDPVYCDPASQALLSRVKLFAPSEAVVLITGETGTGKELVARQIHQYSDRRQGPFVAVNCGAFADSLVESELFGHERGAFTGAMQRQAGWFEAAHGGTLFLDEVGELSLNVQVKLLRVLQERTVSRLGSRTPLAVDVRIVAATHVDLWQLVREGRFREDLLYRLRVGTIDLPPLRMRPADILPLAQRFVDQYASRSQGELVRLSAEAETALLSHRWPGNVRELENVIHQALIIRRSGLISAADLNLVRPGVVDNANATSVADILANLHDNLNKLFALGPNNLSEMLEQTITLGAYEFANRNQLYAADVLGISRNVLRTRLQRFGLLGGGYQRRAGKDRGGMASE